MTLIGVNVRRTIGLLLAVVLLFGATTVIASQSADAAYPGGSDWIVFENDSGGDFDLFVVPVDGGTPTVISDSLFWQVDPVFSPDGTKLAFASNHEGTSSIYVSGFDPSGPSMDAQASWIRVSSGGSDGEPTWSPDGLSVAFQRRFNFNVSGTADASSASVLIDDATGLSGPANFDSRGVLVGQTVTNNSTMPSPTVGLVVSVDSETQVTTDIAWTAGDSYVISVSHRQIMTAAADGTDSGSETQLGGQGATPAYSDYQPSWDPDGALIAFTTTRNGNADIYTFTTAGTSPTNLTKNSGVPTIIDAWATSPSWSPDGDSVAFQTKEPGTAVENIWTVNRAGDVHDQVTSGAADEIAPAWSPDGTEIAYQDVASGAIYVVAAGGGAGTAVTTAGTPAGTHSAPDWRPALAGVDDADSVDEHDSVIVDVLDNDLVLNASGGAVVTSATLVTAPTLGTATRNIDNTFTYEHTGPEIGTSPVVDTFEYTVAQGASLSTAVVTITINPVNDDPVAVADAYDVSHGATLTVSTVAEGVLGNDSDPEGGGLSASLVDDVSHGTLSLAADGTFSTPMMDCRLRQLWIRSRTPPLTAPTIRRSPLLRSMWVPRIPILHRPRSLARISVAPASKRSFSVDIVDGSGPKVYAWSITHNSTVVASGATATIDYTPAVTGAHTVAVTVTDDAGADTDTATFTSHDRHRRHLHQRHHLACQ